MPQLQYFEKQNKLNRTIYQRQIPHWDNISRPSTATLNSFRSHFANSMNCCHNDITLQTELHNQLQNVIEQLKKSNVTYIIPPKLRNSTKQEFENIINQIKLVNTYFFFC